MVPPLLPCITLLSRQMIPYMHKFRDMFNEYEWNYYDPNHPYHEMRKYNYPTTKMTIYDQGWNYENETTSATSSMSPWRELPSLTNDERKKHIDTKEQMRAIRKSML